MSVNSLFNPNKPSGVPGPLFLLTDDKRKLDQLINWVDQLSRNLMVNAVADELIDRGKIIEIKTKAFKPKGETNLGETSSLKPKIKSTLEPVTLTVVRIPHLRPTETDLLLKCAHTDIVLSDDGANIYCESFVNSVMRCTYYRDSERDITSIAQIVAETLKTNFNNFKGLQFEIAADYKLVGTHPDGKFDILQASSFIRLRAEERGASTVLDLESTEEDYFGCWKIGVCPYSDLPNHPLLSEAFSKKWAERPVYQPRRFIFSDEASFDKAIQEGRLLSEAIQLFKNVYQAKTFTDSDGSFSSTSSLGSDSFSKPEFTFDKKLDAIQEEGGVGPKQTDEGLTKAVVIASTDEKGPGLENSFTLPYAITTIMVIEIAYRCLCATLRWTE